VDTRALTCARAPIKGSSCARTPPAVGRGERAGRPASLQTRRAAFNCKRSLQDAGAKSALTINHYQFLSLIYLLARGPAEFPANWLAGWLQRRRRRLRLRRRQRRHCGRRLSPSSVCQSRQLGAELTQNQQNSKRKLPLPRSGRQTKRPKTSPAPKPKPACGAQNLHCDFGPPIALTVSHWRPAPIRFRSIIGCPMSPLCCSGQFQFQFQCRLCAPPADSTRGSDKPPQPPPPPICTVVQRAPVPRRHAHQRPNPAGRPAASAWLIEHLAPANPTPGSTRPDNSRRSFQH